MDVSLAQILFSKACDGEEMPGCRQLAASYYHLTPPDYGQAGTFYQKACDGGDFSSCSSLADMYTQGIGFRRDLKQARILNEKACDGGYQDACGKTGTQ
jgi:hypothetical protein